MARKREGATQLQRWWRRRLRRRHLSPVWAIPIACVIVGASIVAAQEVRRLETPPPAVPVRAENAVGDATCLACHTDKAPFEGTAHHLTSRLPVRSAIAGSFAPGHDVLITSNPALHFRMDSTASGYYEVAVSGRAPDTTVHAERIAYVVGSGRKGQTYLYWRGNRLFELPVSYWIGPRAWMNSPGYRDGTAHFDRAVPPRCLECHATSFESVPYLYAENAYHSSTAVPGITCEVCHGSGVAHVTRERSRLRPLLRRIVPPAIANPVRLPRERQLELCARCHGGLGVERAPAFSYAPGAPLAAYLELAPPPPTAALDVHDNQVALLERSRCFQSSNMTCATCHDVHRTQRDPTAISQRCLGCHTAESCGLYPERHATLVGHCVNCHMPALTSNAIISAFAGSREQPKVRTHWIKVYPEVRDSTLAK